MSADELGGDRAPEAPLERYANNPSTSTPESGPHDRRSARFAARVVLWRESSLKRLRSCGRYPVTPGGRVALRLKNGVAGLAGLASCGSVWACPVCASKILARRGLEIGLALTTAMAIGHKLGFLTLTMRHDRGQSLDELWAAGQKGWTRVTTGRSWALAQKRCGVTGWVRVWEVTHGSNGWHVHVHVVLVLDGATTPDSFNEVASGMFQRWSHGLQASGLRAPLVQGQEWHLVGGERAGEDLAGYIASATKSGADSMGFELTHSMPGRARSGLKTRPPFELLADLVETGEKRALQLWHEWETVSHGKRQIGWSKGLRDLLRVGVEASDEEVAAEELGSAADDLVVIEADGWKAMRRHPERIPVLLAATESGRLAGARLQLDLWGDVAYVVA